MDHHPDSKEGSMDEVVADKNVPNDNKEAVTPPKNIIRPTDKETHIISFIVAALIPLVFISTIYFIITLKQLSVRLTDLSYYVGSIENRTVSLENRQTEFNGQLTQLDGKLTAFSNSPV